MSNPTALQPLPTYAQVEPHVILLTNYHILYGHYFFGSPLPSDFPPAIIKEFPNRSYKRQLKAAIETEQKIVNDLEGIQKEYLADYYSLYGHYFFGQSLPADFPQQIVDQFPNKSYKQQLKTAIASLQAVVNKETK